MTREIINTGTVANDGTGDTLRTAGTKINNNFREIYTKFGDSLGGNLNLLSALTDSGLDINGTNGRVKVGINNPVGDVSIDFPDSAGNVVVDTAIQILTNKTIDSADINNPAVLNLRLKDNDSSHTYDFIPGALTANVNINIPALSSNDTLTLNNATQTIQNKTLRSSTLVTPNIRSFLADSSSNPTIQFTNAHIGATGATRQRIKLVGAAAGDTTGPIFSVIAPSDTNAGIKIENKGNGAIKLDKLAYDTPTAFTSGASFTSTGPNSTNIVLNNASLSVTLADGTSAGEVKIFTNINAGAAATVTPTNFSQGTSISLDQFDTAQLIWHNSNWHLIGGYGYTVNP